MRKIASESAAPCDITVINPRHLTASELIEKYELCDESQKDLADQMDIDDLEQHDFLIFIHHKNDSKIPILCTDQNWEEINTGLYDILYQFQNAFHDKINFELKDLIKQIKILKSKSLSLFQAMFGKKYSKIKKIFRSALASDEIPVIHLESPINNKFPIEFMFIDYDEKGYKKYEDHIDQTFRFIGFSFLIRRYSDRWPKTENCKTTSDKLLFKYFCHINATSFKSERSFFTLLSQEIIKLKGPWPMDSGDYLIANFKDDMKKHIIENSNDLLKLNRCSEVIQHFTCHCDINPKINLNSELIFGNDFSISLGELVTGLGCGCEGLPILFFNACRAGEIKPYGFSFPIIFMEKKYFGARAFIGPQVEISGTFAQEFSKMFYKKLLEGCTIGEALLKAKRFFIEAFNNPLGLLYMFYGDPEIKISNGVEKFPQIIDFIDLSK